MAELLKFRCFQCGKPIGAPASKSGKVVNCPTCGVALVVPSPESEGSGPDPEAFRPEALGLSLEPERISPTKVSPPAALGPVGPDPIAFLERAVEPESDERPDASSVEVKNEPDEIPDLPDATTEPLVSRKRGRSLSASNEPNYRARDVVFPRTAAVAWAMFAILALAFAFLAGLFLGHFIWK